MNGAPACHADVAAVGFVAEFFESGGRYLDALGRARKLDRRQIEARLELAGTKPFVSAFACHAAFSGVTKRRRSGFQPCFSSKCAGTLPLEGLLPAQRGQRLSLTLNASMAFSQSASVGTNGLAWESSTRGLTCLSLCSRQRLHHVRKLARQLAEKDPAAA